MSEPTEKDVPETDRTSALVEGPAEPPPPEPPTRVLEEAYFHINNGGLTLSVVEQGPHTPGSPFRHLTLQARASHFGRGMEVAVPLLSREMVAWVQEALTRTARYLADPAQAEVRLSFAEKHDSLKPQYKVVTGRPVPPRSVRHEVNGPGFVGMYSEDKSAEVVAEMLAADKPASPWIRTADRLPEPPAGSNPYHIWVLAFYKGEQKILPFNPHEKCWDDESGDDYMCGPLEVSHWMPKQDDPE